MSLKRIIFAMRKGYRRHDRAIWAAATGLLAIGTAMMAAKETFEHREELEEVYEEVKSVKEHKEVLGDHYKTTRNRIYRKAIKKTLMSYKGTIAMAICTELSVISTHKLNAGKQAALIASYKASEAAFKEFTEKAKETIGETKVEKIKDAVLADHVLETPMPSEKAIELNNQVPTEMGLRDYPCWDDFSGRYFLSSRTKIEKALVKAAGAVYREMFVPLNYIYEELGLGPCEAGRHIGYEVDDLGNGEIPAKFSTIETDEYGPVLILSLAPSIIIDH